ncbi:LamG domain-containing protein [Candidatus Gracilibacteria bacterium]|nr:LamG domain-containing protein [Candidatus Gracilibacteria bacterium]
MRKKLLISLLIFLGLVGGTFVYWDEVLGMLGISGDSTLSLNKGLIAHYPLSSDSMKNSTTFADLTPNGNDGTLTAGTGGFTTDRKGQSNGAYDFVPNTSYVTLDSEIALGTFSIALWFNVDDLTSTRSLIGHTTDTYGRIYITNSGNTIAVEATGNGVSHSPGQTINTGQWYHIVVTRTGNTTNMYIDGTVTPGSPFTVNGTFTLDEIGRERTANYFDGKISDMRIYNRVLSTDEISLLYESYNSKTNLSSLEKGLVGHWTLDQKNQTAIPLTVANWDFSTSAEPNNWGEEDGWTISDGTANADGTGNGSSGDFTQDIGLVAGKTYKATFDIVEYTSGDLQVSFGAGTFYNITEAVGTISVSGTLGVNGLIYFRSNLFNGKIDNVRVEEMAGIADITPNENHGTSVNAPSFVTDRKGQSNKAMSFNGSTDKITGNTSDTLQGSSVVSASLWLNNDISPTAGDNKYLFATSNGTNTGLGLRIYETFLAIGGRSESGDSFQHAQSDSDPITNGAWHHLVGIWDFPNDTMDLYLDGTRIINDTTNTWGSDTYAESSGTFSINTASFDGDIDDVRLYNRELTTDEISELYESYDRKLKTGSLNKGLIGYWPMKSKYYNATTNRIDDTTPSGNHGTFTAGTGSVTADYTDFDGADTIIELENFNILFGDGQEFSISMWFKTGSSIEQSLLHGLGASNQFIKFSADGTIGTIKPSTISGSNSGGTTDSYNDELWHHITVMYDAGGTIIYVDGVEDIGGAYGNLRTSISVILGGREYSAGSYAQFFDGQISDVRIYDRVLSTDEISLLYSMGR